jgi:hypothetical protein
MYLLHLLLRGRLPALLLLLLERLLFCLLLILTLQLLLRTGASKDQWMVAPGCDE